MSSNKIENKFVISLQSLVINADSDCVCVYISPVLNCHICGLTFKSKSDPIQIHSVNMQASLLEGNECKIADG